MRIFDCTLRDGANVVGKGFDAHLTTLMIEGLIKAGITTIEMGNALGLGAYEANQSIAPCTDLEYANLAKPYLDKAEIGMFIGVRNATQANADFAKEHRLGFLRVGANAGDGRLAEEGIKRIKQAGVKCCYSLMKAYILDAEALAEEAKMLEGFGLDEITIMDSAGTMLPDQVARFTAAMSKAVKIPVAFHGHDNLGLAVANALAAYDNGAQIFDAGLLGMARSAGNCATELLAAVLYRRGQLQGVDLFSLLDFLDEKLIPEMRKHNYHHYVNPVDIVYGIAGCHSSFAGMLKDTAQTYAVPQYQLILEVSKRDQKAPSQELVNEVAKEIKEGLK